MPFRTIRAKSMAPPAEAESLELAAGMPPVAGRPLEPPRFHQTSWKVGQVFTSRDDPDRMLLPWQPPAFALEPAELARQGSKAWAEDLRLPENCRARGSIARVVRDVLTEEQCTQLIAQVNAKGFTPALLNIGGNTQTLDPTVRDGHRVIVDSKELADYLLEVLRPFLPEQLGGPGNDLVELNERLRFLCYTPGQSFDPHLDGCYRRPHGHDRFGDRSRITVQLYLHDVPEKSGGATTFFPGRSHEVRHQPTAGSVLLFTQDLEHEGSVLVSGLKYTLRTEAMYSSPEPPCSWPF